MRLTQIGIRGYKSLTDVHLDDLGGLVCLVGKNSAGKSAILEALWSLRNLEGKAPWEDAAARVTDQQRDRMMTVQLTALLGDVERRAFCERLMIGNMFDGVPFSQDEVDELVNAGFARFIDLAAGLCPSPLGNWLPQIWAPYRLRASGRGEGDWWLLAHLGREDAAPVSGDDRLLLAKPVSMVALARRKGRLEYERSDVPPGQAFVNHQNNPRNVLGWVPTLKGLRDAFIFLSSERQPRDEGETPPLPVRDLSGDAGNLAQVLATLRAGYDDLFAEILARVREVFPDIERIQTPMHWTAENRVTVTSRSRGRHFDERLSQLGSGVTQVLVAALLAATAREGRILLLEEPELHLHPGAQRALVRLLRQVSDRNQIILTTHSPHIAGALEPSEVFLLELEDGRTIVAPGRRPGTLRQIANNLGIRPHEGLLQPCVVLVDGASDARILSAWYATLVADGALPRSQENAGIAFFPLHGETNFAYFMDTGALTNLGIHFVLVQDRDAGPDTTFKAAAEHWVLARGGVVRHWRRREIENYLHPQAVRRVLEVPVEEIGPDDDVKDALTRALQQRAPQAKYLPGVHGPKIAEEMTASEIRHMDEAHEVVDFLRELASMAGVL